MDIDGCLRRFADAFADTNSDTYANSNSNSNSHTDPDPFTIGIVRSGMECSHCLFRRRAGQREQHELQGKLVDAGQ